MRLTMDRSQGAFAVDVSCMTCAKRHQLATSLVDLDGPAFRAYYCSVECCAHGTGRSVVNIAARRAVIVDEHRRAHGGDPF